MTDLTDLDETTADASPAAVPARRRFFALAGAAGIGLALAACGDDDDTGGTATTRGGSDDTSGGSGGGDADVATFAAGLELLAANTYKAGLDAATSGALGDVPPAVAEFATTAMAHHQAASDALAQAAGGITPTVPTDIEASVNDEFAKVTDVVGLAKLARTLELQAAATYLDVLPNLQSTDAINLVGSILPIERQHAAILTFVLGEYPVPDTFATADESLAP